MVEYVYRLINNEVVNVVLCIIESLSLCIRLSKELLFNYKVILLSEVFVSGVYGVTNNGSVHIFTPELKISHLHSTFSTENVEYVFIPVVCGKLGCISFACINSTGISGCSALVVFPTLLTRSYCGNKAKNSQNESKNFKCLFHKSSIIFLQLCN